MRLAKFQFETKLQKCIGEVYHHIYGCKSHFTAPLARRSKTKFPTAFSTVVDTTNGFLWYKIFFSFAPFLKEMSCIFLYSKTCVKWPLKNRQNKDLNDEW